MCRLQRKPVLLVSPRVTFPALVKLQEHVRDDPIAAEWLDQVATEIPIKPDPKALPVSGMCPWWGADHFFDGFGFRYYRAHFRWQRAV